MSRNEQQSHDFGYKRILDYSPDELDLAIGIAVAGCEKRGLDFYAVLRGVDAYMEKRRRKVEAAKAEAR